MQGVSVMTWLQIHREVAALLMSPDDLDAVVEAKGSWGTVAPQIARLTASSRTGDAVFSFAANVLLAEQYRSQIDAGLETILASDFDEAAIHAMKSQCEEKIQLLQDKACMQSRREIKAISRSRQLGSTSLVTHFKTKPQR